jgi:hypothetical protein
MDARGERLLAPYTAVRVVDFAGNWVRNRSDCQKPWSYSS